MFERHLSVSFITVHDGFTLADLVSYNRKHTWRRRTAGRTSATG